MIKKYKLEQLTEYSTYSDRIKYALALRDKTAAELARGTGISESIISRYLSGIVEPKRDNIVAISKFLNVNEMWLMGISKDITREHYSTPSKRDKVNAYLKELDNQDIDALLIVMEAMFKNKLPH